MLVSVRLPTCSYDEASCSIVNATRRNQVEMLDAFRLLQVSVAKAAGCDLQDIYSGAPNGPQ